MFRALLLRLKVGYFVTLIDPIPTQGRSNTQLSIPYQSALSYRLSLISYQHLTDGGLLIAERLP